MKKKTEAFLARNADESYAQCGHMVILPNKGANCKYLRLQFLYELICSLSAFRVS